MSNTDPSSVQPLAEYFRAHMPAEVNPPGEDHLYSSNGYSLAALIVEEVSGMPFDHYVEQNILAPLGMTRTAYLLPSANPKTLATGYHYKDGVQTHQPSDYASDYPSGSIVSTAEDMSRFMLTELGGGCYQETGILEPGTLKEMHHSQAETSSRDRTVTYGFFERELKGVLLLDHRGAIRGFGSSLTLLPEHNLGYFLTFNSECLESDACQLSSEFREHFLEQIIQ